MVLFQLICRNQVVEVLCFGYGIFRMPQSLFVILAMFDNRIHMYEEQK